MIFVDTGAWFAAFVPNDPDHAAAEKWLDSNTEPLVTTDYVVDELLTLLKIRGEFERALRLGESLLDESVSKIAWVTPDDVRAAWEVFRSYRDKGWSFTDCVSYAVIDRLGASAAFSFDQHFRQFGTVSVEPPIDP